ncbi:hypothetical protein [Sphingomonas sp. Leaf4]|uniref:hypothetical protein n=1 Tax=Sphingomonas sp. Leaf4 TaxID=2876553 RepID=UPI001E51FE68|nr:hypothetical protein [Sphingomonas sp. Leaf4]
MSPYVLSVDTSAIIVNATYLGETKGGQLPRRVAVSVRQGAADVTGDVDVSVTATTSAIDATYAAGVVTLSRIDGDGTVQVAASRAGVAIDSVRISITRKLDAPPPPAPNRVSTEAYTGDANSTSYQAAPSYGIVTVKSGADGSLPVEIYVDYLVAQTGTTFRSLTIGGKAMYRVAGSGGTWSDLVGDSSGTASTYLPGNGDHENGTFYVSQTPTLTPNTSYEVGLLLRKASGNGQLGYVSSLLTVGA